MSDFIDADTYSNVRLSQLGTTGIWVDQMGDQYRTDSVSGFCWRMPQKES